MKPGDVAPEFDLPAHDGRHIRLRDQLEKGPVVLFFYPKALTPGCTAESCHFRDVRGEFETAGAQPLGISADPVDRQQRFDDKHAFGFPLLSDVDRSVAKAYGVKRPGPLFNRRMTFVIGTDGTLLDVIHSETNMQSHADRALAAIKERSSAAK